MTFVLIRGFIDIDTLVVDSISSVWPRGANCSAYLAI